MPGSASPQRARGHSDGEGIGGLAIGAVAVPPPFADALACRRHGPLRVATVGAVKAAAALAHRYG